MCIMHIYIYIIITYNVHYNTIHYTILISECNCPNDNSHPRADCGWCWRGLAGAHLLVPVVAVLVPAVLMIIIMLIMLII